MLVPAGRRYYTGSDLESDGSNPRARLLDVNGIVYGTTKNGGFFNNTTSNAGNGTIFALKP